MKYFLLVFLIFGIITGHANEVLSKKENFINKMYPAVKTVYEELNNKYLKIKDDIKNNTNLTEINNLKKEYKVSTDDNLLLALKPHPVSIVLAQGAIESAWLTSRFSKKANNVFGVWSFSEKDNRIEAKGSRGDKKIYLKKYETLTDSIRDYYKNIGRSWAFKELRKNRILTNNYKELIPHFEMYSEERKEYVDKLKKVIEFNNFHKYDS